MTEPLSFTKFLSVWLPTLAVAAVVPSAQTPLGDRFLVDLAGLPIPVVTCILGLVGILAARPFTMRAEAELGWPLRLLVTFIMIVLVELWIIENRPGWLFAFVVAIGLGFSGFSLLEMFGQQVKAWVQRALGKATNSSEGPDGP
ncbi:hypothetical protein [Erythrobacter sp. WG]|uniref:hypothetical protein n=1 Tax=Erythrobacter sp. WG TaxID=2985510 RepID=UPI00226E665D|nr:hypothetical protein [Erythrobacter sp. WG]MCX9146603.1 hypothetical protein [Erythrobacter sp. WG]